jgi:glucose-1-phosphate thymidylyltransferase
MTDTIPTDRAMILAGGLGTRMQREVEGLDLDETTDKIASAGAKGLIPIGRPFLDHTLQALLDAGCRDFCLIVPPGASILRKYYEAVAEQLDGATIDFAVQPEPLGTAHAVGCGRSWAADRPFMVLNSDNFYYPDTVYALMRAPAPASIAFERQGLIAGSNIPAERIARFAVMDIDEQGRLKRIVEKPPEPDRYAVDGKLYVSMNCFLFTDAIFTACDAIEPDPVRKEYELPTAVQYCIDELGQTFTAAFSNQGVLDLTGRADIGPVREMLADHPISFSGPEQLEVE